MEEESKVYEMSDDILISPRLYESWMSYAPLVMRDIKKEFLKQKKDLLKGDIPDEQIRIYADGTAEIFVFVEKIQKEIKMKVPKDEWVFKK